MSTLDTNPVIFGLRDFYNSSPEAREILTHFASWKENKKVTGVKRVHRRLSRVGSMVDRPQIEQFFRTLHNIGLGEFISGEGVRRPRFIWGYPLTRLSQVATGDAWELEPLPDPLPTNGQENSDADEVLDSGEPVGLDQTRAGATRAGATRAGATRAGESGSVGTIKHTFRLRGALSVKFRLPRDLTMTEAVRLAEYIKTLPFGF